jgi:hypothetical protein
MHDTPFAADCPGDAQVPDHGADPSRAYTQPRGAGGARVGGHAAAPVQGCVLGAARYGSLRGAMETSGPTLGMIFP